MNDVATAQDEFRSAVVAHWTAVDAGDAKTADRETAELDKLVNRWDKRQQIADLLMPLLVEDELPAVRIAAATYLLHHGDGEQALPVLEALAENDEIGLVAEDAELVLIQWRRQQADS
jgi:HEAT repeat protein